MSEVWEAVLGKESFHLLHRGQARARQGWGSWALLHLKAAANALSDPGLAAAQEVEAFGFGVDRWGGWCYAD